MTQPHAHSSYAFEIETKKPFRLYFISDVHRDSKLCSEKKYKECLSAIKKDDYGFVFFVGDLMDKFSSSERKVKVRSENDLHAETVEDERSRGKYWADRFCEEWEPVKNRIICGIGGNHYANIYSKSDSGSQIIETSDQYIARGLGFKYGGGSCFVRLSIHGHHAVNSKVYINHGKKGAGSLSSDISDLIRTLKDFPNADIVAKAHTHRSYGVYVPALDITDRGNPHVYDIVRVGVRSSNFQRHFVDGATTYSSQFDTSPTILGYTYLEGSIVTQGGRGRMLHYEFRTIA